MDMGFGTGLGGASVGENVGTGGASVHAARARRDNPDPAPIRKVRRLNDMLQR